MVTDYIYIYIVVNIEDIRGTNSGIEESFGRDKRDVNGGKEIRRARKSESVSRDEIGGRKD